MQETVDAAYENGVLRPLKPLTGIEEHGKVKLIVITDSEPHSLADCIGILPDEDAREMTRLIEEEFGKVDPGDWE